MNMMRSPQQVAARRGMVTLFNTLAAAAFSFVAIDNIGEHPARAPFYILLWAAWLAIPLLWVFGVPGGRRWSRAERAQINDELVRAHQATAAKTGLALALVGMAIVSAMTLTGEVVPFWLLPAFTSATVIVTALLFAWLDRRDG